VSDFEFKDSGGGNFSLSGEMSFDTADRILRLSQRQFGGHDVVNVDFSSVTKADSAGLALLLEWKTQARQRQAEIRFTGLPESVVAIARTTEVDHLL